MTLDPDVVHTAPTPRRAFQGWRYLEAADAPADLGSVVSEGGVPAAFARQLREAGVW
jgi:hypothetical protein